MKQLYLLRHGHTFEKSSGGKDIERMLTPTGFQNASQVGNFFQKRKIRPSIIICSTANRTQQTAEIIAKHLSYDFNTVDINSEVYDASVSTLLNIVNHFKEEWKTVVLIAHNPSISYLSEYITGHNIGNISTCGLVSIQFKMDRWMEISKGNGDFQFYEYPPALNF